MNQAADTELVVHASGKTVRVPKPNTARFQIWDLAKQGLGPKDIAVKVGKTAGYVYTELRFLRLGGLLEPSLVKYQRKQSTPFERVVFEQDAVQIRHVPTVVCPKCHHEFKVLSP